MRLEVVRAAVIVIASGVGVGTATIAPVRVTAQEVPQSREAPTFTLTGQIVDAFNERPIIAAVIKVPDLRRFVFSDVRGRFLSPTSRRAPGTSSSRSSATTPWKARSR